MIFTNCLMTRFLTGEVAGVVEIVVIGTDGGTIGAAAAGLCSAADAGLILFLMFKELSQGVVVVVVLVGV